MKQRELEECAICRRGMAHRGDVHFYRVKVEQFILDGRAIQHQHGLEQLLGSPALASVMGTDPDIARGLGEMSGLLCADCMMSPAAAILEALAAREDTAFARVVAP